MIAVAGLCAIGPIGRVLVPFLFGGALLAEIRSENEGHGREGRAFACAALIVCAASLGRWLRPAMGGDVHLPSFVAGCWVSLPAFAALLGSLADAPSIRASRLRRLAFDAFAGGALAAPFLIAGSALALRPLALDDVARWAALGLASLSLFHTSMRGAALRYVPSSRTPAPETHWRAMRCPRCGDDTSRAEPA